MAKGQIKIWTDGGARGNPGPAAIGVVVKEGRQTIYETARFLGRATNNQAEYQAVITALEWLRSQNITADTNDLILRVDSELVAKQITGLYKVKHDNMKPLYQQTQALLGLVGSVKIMVIPRSQNKRADYLVNEALDKISTVRSNE